MLPKSGQPSWFNGSPEHYLEMMNLILQLKANAEDEHANEVPMFDYRKDDTLAYLTEFIMKNAREYDNLLHE